jgi:hypothetical protein
MNIELTVWVLSVFRRYSGLYFWSVLVANWSIGLHAIGYVLKECVPDCPWVLSTLIAEIGWVGMVTGFAIVLHSRLHLVTFIIQNPKVLRLTLAMIITDAFLFHVPTAVFQFGLSDPQTHTRYLTYLRPMERVQILGFSLQEIIITTIYIYGTTMMVQQSFNPKIRTTMRILVLIQVLVMLLDITVIVLDYCNYYTLKAILQSFFYAVKLRLEFVILNQFRDVIAKSVPTDLGTVPYDDMTLYNRQSSHLTLPASSGGDSSVRTL